MDAMAHQPSPTFNLEAQKEIGEEWRTKKEEVVIIIIFLSLQANISSSLLHGFKDVYRSSLMVAIFGHQINECISSAVGTMKGLLIMSSIYL